MAANKQQGSYLSLFWTACTVFCAGIAYFAEGFGKLVFLLGLAGVVISLVGFVKIKSLEGKTAGPATIASLKAYERSTDLRVGGHRRELGRGPRSIARRLRKERGGESAIYRFYGSENHHGA